jgi:hypothetical protein
MRLPMALFLAALCVACAEPAPLESVEAQMNPLAERYVRLGLALGEHDADYVDAYFGPDAWRDEARQQALSLQAIAVAADSLAGELQNLDTDGVEPIIALRQNYLATHVQSLAAVARARDGHVYSFDEESKAIYGFVAPSYPIEYYEQVLAELESLLPGEGPLHERYDAFYEQLIIPEDRLEAVVANGIEECRARTLQHISLPDGEQYEMEMVSGNAWGAYNWYQGDARSLIQIETGRPNYLGTSIQLGCHEGYPGHHAFSSLLDYTYGQGRGWVEFSMFPLFSPQGIIFEGSGNFAEVVAFPEESRIEFLREVIVPIAGLESVDFEALNQIRAAKAKMGYVGIEAARYYLDGDWSKEETVAWLTEYALVPPERIDAWFGFTNRYRAYRINYVLGEDLVAAYVRQKNPSGDAEKEWQALAELLLLPPAPALFEN